MPLISIVIPTYNRAHFLKKALNSIINQTFRNWEAIVIDSYSKDETQAVVKKFEDTRIKYIKIRNNGIVAKSRNAGINYSKSEWVAFLDSDDWWTKDKLEICYNNINKNIDFIYHDLEIKSENFSLIKNKNKSFKLTKPIFIDLLTNINPISNSSVMVRKKILNRVGKICENRKLIAVEDYHTWLKISKISNNFLYFLLKF